MSNLDFRFNNGNGTVLCNVCSTMLVPYAKHSEQIDCAHICDDCYEKLRPAIEKLMELKDRD